MAEDAISDLASLIKAVAMTTVVLQPVERGRLELDVPASRHWLAFDSAGRAGTTLR